MSADPADTPQLRNHVYVLKDVDLGSLLKEWLGGTGGTGGQLYVFREDLFQEMKTSMHQQFTTPEQFAMIDDEEQYHIRQAKNQLITQHEQALDYYIHNAGHTYLQSYLDRLPDDVVVLRDNLTNAGVGFFRQLPHHQPDPRPPRKPFE
jgi:hypothetical protein